MRFVFKMLKIIRIFATILSLALRCIENLLNHSNILLPLFHIFFQAIQMIMEDMYYMEKAFYLDRWS
jgi:hypothetical protein